MPASSRWCCICRARSSSAPSTTSPRAGASMADIDYRISPPLGDILLNRLYTAVWPDHRERDFQRVLERSVTYVGAFDDDVLVGFVYVAWDGGAHAFLLEPTVLPGY